MLQVNQIRASYGKIEVLRDMTLEIPEATWLRCWEEMERENLQR